MDTHDVTNYLRTHSVKGEILHLNQHVSSVDAAAQALRISPNSFAKSVLFDADSLLILVIANGTKHINSKRVADYLGLARKRVRLVDAPKVLEATGFAVGTVPPFGHKAPLRTLIDKGVLAQAEVYAGGGAAEVLLRISPLEIARVTNAEVVDLTDPS